ncbi:MAG: hypothetical protein ACJ8C4_19710 [Gemmataceae bacterium]
MIKVELNPAVKALLPTLDQEIEVHEPNGRVVGYFITAKERERLRKLEAATSTNGNAAANPMLSDDELDKAEEDAERDGEWFTSEEVIRHLESQ